MSHFVLPINDLPRQKRAAAHSRDVPRKDCNLGLCAGGARSISSTAGRCGTRRHRQSEWPTQVAVSWRLLKRNRPVANSFGVQPERCAPSRVGCRAKTCGRIRILVSCSVRGHCRLSSLPKCEGPRASRCPAMARQSRDGLLRGRFEPASGIWSVDWHGIRLPLDLQDSTERWGNP